MLLNYVIATFVDTQLYMVGWLIGWVGWLVGFVVRVRVRVHG